MRDDEFAKGFTELAPRLEMYFLKRMKKSIPKADKALLVNDLVQETGMKALVNSRKEKHAHRSIEELLFIKADNVWKNHINPRKRRVEVTMLEDDPVTDAGAHHKMVYAETIEFLKGISKESTWYAIKRRQDGYTDLEIALELGITQENLRQLISRQIKKIVEKWYHLNYF